MLLCPEDPPEKSLLGQEETDEEDDEDLIESYLANSDPEAANLVIEEKVLLAREEETCIFVVEDLSEDSDSGSLLERSPAGGRLSESHNGGLTPPLSVGERVLISRELPEGDNEHLGSASESEEGSLISYSVSWGAWVSQEPGP